MLIVLIIQIVIIVILLLLLYAIYKPSGLKILFNKVFTPLSPVLYPDRIIKTESTFGKRRLNSYFIPNKSSKTCLIWFHGGCFIQEKPSNVLPFLEMLSQDMNVYTFDYPLPFDFTLDDTLVYINKNLKDFFNEYSFDTYAIGGDSAGTFLALKLYEFQTIKTDLYLEPLPELLNVQKFVGVCGFYDMTFGGNKMGEMAFNFYVLRGVSNKKKYISNVSYPNNLLLTSSSDFLNRQTTVFNDKFRNVSDLISYTTPNSIHCFIASTHLPETARAHREIALFINDGNQ